MFSKHARDSDSSPSTITISSSSSEDDGECEMVMDDDLDDPKVIPPPVSGSPIKVNVEADRDARQRREYALKKERAYEEKLNFLKEELKSLDQHNHDRCTEGLVKLINHRDRNLAIIRTNREKEMKCIEVEFDEDVKLIQREFKDQAAALKESLIQELEEQKRQIENERDSSHAAEVTLEDPATDMTFEESCTLRRSLRLTHNEPEVAPLPIQSRKKSVQMNRKKKAVSTFPKHSVVVQLDKQAITQDLQTIQDDILRLELQKDKKPE